MANLVEWIDSNREKEEVLGIVIGEMGWGDYGKDDVPQYNTQPRGKVLLWREAKPLLDYDFSSGYGAPGCNAIYVWTKSWVMFVVQYDGSTRLKRIPRNPTDIMPEMPGE